jgi:hypothetical protein
LARALAIIPLVGIGTTIATYEPFDPWNLGGSLGEEVFLGETPIGMVRDLSRVVWEGTRTQIEMMDHAAADARALGDEVGAREIERNTVPWW